MRQFSAAIFLPIAFTVLLSPAAQAQFGRGANDWSTAAFDAQRSSWVRTDPKISKDSLSKPGFALTWKIGLAKDKPGILGPAILIGRYIGYRGFRSFAFLGGAGDNVYTVDTDLSRLEWHDHLAPAATLPAGCAVSTVPLVVRPGVAAFPMAPNGRGGGSGRSTAARSGVGEPLQGAITLPTAAPAANIPAFPGAGRGLGRGAPDPNARRVQNSLFILTSDGMLHSVYLSSGEKSADPIKFVQPGAGARGLILIDNVAYVATSGGCGAVSGVSAVNVITQQLSTWAATGGSVAGAEGPAIGPDGTLYVATAGSAAGVTALEAKTLQPKDSYAGGQDMVSSPVMFEYKDKALVAVVSKGRKILLLDTKSLGGADHHTALSTATVEASPDSLATWQDAGGTRWLIGNTAGAIRAWKVVDREGGPALETAWVSPEIASPVAPMIVNGVVFAASKGSRSTPAVLYALDSATGKQLWNSGKIIASAVAESGLSAGDSQVMLGTADGTLYAFGFPIEH